MKKTILSLLIGVLLVLFGISAYERFLAPSNEKDFAIEKDEANSLAVKVRFGAGDLHIYGAAADWMNATFNVKDKKHLPNVTYKNKNEIGYVTVEQKSSVFSFISFNRGNQNNKWDMQLTNDIPIDLDVEMGVSDATLDLKGTKLRTLTIDGGVSSSTIDLSGKWQNSFQAEMDIGIGDMTILLPKQTGIKLTIDKGLGNINMKKFIALGNGVFVNEAYESEEISIEIDLNIGIGDVTLKLVE